MSVDRSLIQTLIAHAESHPRKLACAAVSVTRDGFEARELTWSELMARAASASRRLIELGIAPGDRVALSVNEPLAFATWFLGALGAGAIAVPMPGVGELGTPSSFVDRVKSVCRDAKPSLVLVDDKTRWRRAVALSVPVRVEVAALPAVARDGLDAWRALPLAGPGAPAFLQYTSGSTGEPKGVIITHANIVANARGAAEGAGFAEGDAMLSWLPLHHDMGLIGSLLVFLYLRLPTYLMRPSTFVLRPVSWLQAIQRFRATISVAPPFAYGLCAKKLTDEQLAGLDLSSWRLAFCGAEPIDPRVVRAFGERFAAYGFSPSAFYPVYGLAEATLAVAFPTPGAPATYDTRRVPELVSAGRAIPGHEIAILDPETGAPLAAGQVGEIVVRGPSVSPGYWGQAPREGALRTGDLGYVSDGQLYVVDRLKDLVIIAGQKLAPSDIELYAADVEGVRRGRAIAFSVRESESAEGLHVVAEVDLERAKDLDHVRDAVGTTVRKAFGVTVISTVLVPPGTLRKTTSGKLRRRDCRDRFLAGELPELRDASDLARARTKAKLSRLRRTVAGLFAPRMMPA